MFRSILLRVLPPHLSVHLRRWKRGAAARYLGWVASSRSASRLHYAVLARAFAREQHAVAYGRWKYEEDSGSPACSPFMLRRNIHRMEKGLIMRPRRSVFAADYVEETVSAYAARVEGITAGGGAAAGIEDLQWASGVLSGYFEAAAGHPAIESARARFRPLEGEETPGGRPLAPFRRDLTSPSPVGCDDLLALAARRRSVRWFLPRPVPRELIDRAVRVAAESPSACNRQPFHFRIYDDPELVQQVAVLPPGARGFEHNFPAVVVVVGNLRAYFHEKDRHVIYIDGSLAAMSFILALESLGLSSCCINWPDLEPEERRMQELIGLEPDQRVVMVIAVGYPDPDALVPASGKKALDSLRSYNVQ